MNETFCLDLLIKISQLIDHAAYGINLRAFKSLADGAEVTIRYGEQEYNLTIKPKGETNV